MEATKQSVNQIALEVGAKIKERRRQLGFTQSESVKKIGISTSELSRIELGHKVPSYRLLMVICTALGLDKEEMIKMAGYEDFGQAQLSITTIETCEEVALTSVVDETVNEEEVAPCDVKCDTVNNDGLDDMTHKELVKEIRKIRKTLARFAYSDKEKEDFKDSIIATQAETIASLEADLKDANSVIRELLKKTM